ncbi:MAG: polymerase sigma-70 factor, subfamily [Acidobacteriota bacterium]|nr:polymerase sigma-70 factor, subfamily [Acidobacteriota bacterium]
MSKGATVEEATAFLEDASRRWGTRVSFGEPIALRGQELEQVAAAPSDQARSEAEAQFIDRLRTGDTAAFDRLVDERSGEIYALLYRLTDDPEDARDLTQETFLRVFQSIDRFRGDADLKTWIYRIAINQARNRWRWWRRRRRDSTLSLDTSDSHDERPLISRLRSSGNDPEQDTLAHEREDVLRTALHTLGRSYRETVILRDVEGLSYEEIASTLEISIGTVKSRLARGRLELRRKLTGEL